jgi:hypothetical protein
MPYSVDQQIARLQIAIDDPAAMEVLELKDVSRGGNMRK